MSRSWRIFAAWTLDAMLLSAAYLLARFYRTSFGPVSWDLPATLRSLVPVVALQLLALQVSGCRRIPWRWISASDILRFALALALAALPPACWRLFRPADALIPVSYAILALDAHFALFALVGVRLVARLAGQGNAGVLRGGAQDGVRTLLMGEGAAENPLVWDGSLAVLGIVDSDPALQNARIRGIDVLGTLPDAPRLVRQLRADRLVVAPGLLDPAQLRDLSADLQGTGCRLSLLPTLQELPALRDPDITDLLGRAEATLPDAGAQAFYAGATVWVTGAGGSIGSELVRQLAAWRPARLVLLERSEFALYEIHRELLRSEPSFDIVPALVDCADEAAVAPLLKAHPPKAILHAAAYKHVPLLEANPRAAFENNVLGTWNLARLAKAASVPNFLLVSTDKAIHPVSAMGASKRLAERLVSSLQEPNGPTRFCAVRFGNVLGSSGSVVPLFREQIARGGPVTVTDPAMMRYFMTIREAASLILRAPPLSQGGETYLLDMGKPISVAWLAAEMVRLAGKRPGEEIRIVYTGSRPGERLSEELGLDLAKPTSIPKILISPIPALAPGRVPDLLQTVRQLIQENAAPDTLRQRLAPWLD